MKPSRRKILALLREHIEMHQCEEDHHMNMAYWLDQERINFIKTNRLPKDVRDHLFPTPPPDPLCKTSK